MELRARPEVLQAQVLSLTPDMLQSLSFLALPSADLAAAVAAEIEANPLLKWADPALAPPSVFASQAPVPQLRAGGERRSYTAGSGRVATHGSGQSRDGAPSVEDFAHPEAIRLTAHLVRQLDLTTVDPDMRILGRVLIDALDPAGYLTEPLQGIADEFDCTLDEVEAALKLVQDCEPTGVGARSLRECLLLQLHERGQDDAATLKILERLDLVARRDWETLLTITGLSRAEIAKSVKLLTTLDPKPGLAFSDADAIIREPDILVVPASDGTLRVEINPATLPKILVDKDYHTHVAASVTRAEDKSFLRDCLTRARWLSRTLERRAETLLRVAGEIVRQQEGYFRQGMGAMRPLTLKDVAETLDLHESTISRTVSGKSFSSPHGMIAMRALFTAALEATDRGEAHSAKAVCHRIRQLVVDEGKSGHALSDEALARRLAQEGVVVARRTVAKYRAILHIPASSLRQRRLIDAGMEKA